MGVGRNDDQGRSTLTFHNPGKKMSQLPFPRATLAEDTDDNQGTNQGTTLPKKPSNMKGRLSCVRPKGEAGKCWLPHLKVTEQRFCGPGKALESAIQFLKEKGEQADTDNAWPSKQARNHYYECVKYLEECSNLDEMLD